MHISLLLLLLLLIYHGFHLIGSKKTYYFFIDFSLLYIQYTYSFYRSTDEPIHSVYNGAHLAFQMV